MKNLFIKTVFVGAAWGVGRTAQLWWDEWGYDSRLVKYVKQHKVEVAVTIVGAVWIYKGEVLDKV